MYLSANKISRHIGLSTVLFLFVISCSASHEKVVVKKSTNMVKKPINKLEKVKAKAPVLRHIHPENECLKAIIHSHINGNKDHNHPQSCEKNIRSQSNAHSHKANSITGSLRHVHPNGYKKHSHRK